MNHFCGDCSTVGSSPSSSLDARSVTTVLHTSRESAPSRQRSVSLESNDSSVIDITSNYAITDRPPFSIARKMAISSNCLQTPSKGNEQTCVTQHLSLSKVETSGPLSSSTQSFGSGIQEGFPPSSLTAQEIHHRVSCGFMGLQVQVSELLRWLYSNFDQVKRVPCLNSTNRKTFGFQLETCVGSKAIIVSQSLCWTIFEDLLALSTSYLGSWTGTLSELKPRVVQESFARKSFTLLLHIIPKMHILDAQSRLASYSGGSTELCTLAKSQVLIIPPAVNCTPRPCARMLRPKKRKEPPVPTIGLCTCLTMSPKAEVKHSGDCHFRDWYMHQLWKKTCR